MAIGRAGAKNAALYAARILALEDKRSAQSYPPILKKWRGMWKKSRKIFHAGNPENR